MKEAPGSFPLELTTKVQANHDVLGAELGGEVSLLNLQSGTYFTLNAVGASVWRQIQQAKSLEEIKQRLLQEYEVDTRRCESDLRRLVMELQSSGLVELIPA
jgi:hypothetical protein